MKASAVMLVLALVACDTAESETVPLFGADPNRPLDLRAELSLAEVALLGEVVLRLDLYHDREVDALFVPSLPEGVQGEVYALDERPWMDGIWRTYELIFRPTVLGELTIPPFRVTIVGEEETASTPEFTLQVTSLLGEHAAEIEAPAPLFPARVHYLPWVLGGVGGLLAVILLVLWLRRAPRLRQAADSKPLPAHTKALRALSRLRGEPRQTDPQVERFYAQVSSVLRVYLEDRYGLHAPERTTEEFLPEVAQSGLLASGEQQQLREFLQRCDMVKFARMFPGAELHGETLAYVERLVELTRADRQEALA